ncbi:hypothetical protein FB451DRAFT_1395588 [Mycena latifolia]|nr:hypothetical protein FB451DRAFT_1395588 [Mycena latifolia]
MSAFGSPPFTRIFSHYAIKASKARATSNAIFGLQHRIGSLPVREGLVLYSACVDCYLISGCELSLDTDTSLMDDRHLFLRRLLGLNPHSILAVLFTETGQKSSRIQRILHALGRLQYLIAATSERVVKAAFLDSISLLREGKPGWASDLILMLKRLPMPIEVTVDDLLSSKTMEGVAKKPFISVLDDDLQRDIDNLVKTHLLRNQLELQDKSLTLVTRHYLMMVAVPAHRKALTGLLLGDHSLSIERLRYPGRYREAVPRIFRLCRFCRGAVEDEVYALFDCTSEPRLVEIRGRFLAKLYKCDPVLRASYSQMPNYQFLLKLTASRKAVQIFAMYVFDTLGLFQEFPRYFPVVFRIPGQ